MAAAKEIIMDAAGSAGVGDGRHTGSGETLKAGSSESNWSEGPGSVMGGFPLLPGKKKKKKIKNDINRQNFKEVIRGKQSVNLKPPPRGGG